MAALIKDKFVAEIDEPVVVFLVGGHVNNVLAVHHWFWVAYAFIRMIRYLTTHPETGCYGGHTLYRLFPFGMTFQSYWRSVTDLERFARTQDEPHLRAWTKFIRSTGQSGAMSIWHETYIVEPGKYEAVYGYMAPYGLAATPPARIIKPSGRNHNMRGRINPQDETVSDEPLVPLP